MGGFTKLFSSIVTSSLWCQDHAVLRVWVAMLATADATGKVEGAVPGFASLCRVSIPEMERVLGILMAPDEYSRTKDHDGKRLEVCEGGWRILNYMKYRAIREADERREYQREWDRTHRAKTHPTNPTTSDKSDTIRPNPTQAEAEAEAEKIKEGSPSAPVVDLVAKRKRKTKDEKIQGFSPDTKAVVNSLLDIWPQRGTNGDDTSPTDIAIFAQRVSEILDSGNDRDLLIEAGKLYATTPRPKFSAPQYFFGKTAYGGKGDAPWVGYVKLILTKRQSQVAS